MPKPSNTAGGGGGTEVKRTTEPFHMTFGRRCNVVVRIGRALASSFRSLWTWTTIRWSVADRVIFRQTETPPQWEETSQLLQIVIFCGVTNATAARTVARIAVARIKPRNARRTYRSADLVRVKRFR